MIEVLIMIGVIGWFMSTAKRMGKSRLIWGFLGAASYYVPVFVVSLAYGELIKGEVRHDNVGQMIVLGIVLSIASGIICCVLARMALLSGQPTVRERTEPVPGLADSTAHPTPVAEVPFHPAEATPEGRPFQAERCMKSCPRCGMSVVPTSEGQCPSCRKHSFA